jgi:hypothetical protein
VLDRFKESSQSTLFCVLSSVGTHSQVTEGQGPVEPQVMFGSVFFGHRHLASSAITGSLLYRAESQIGVCDVWHVFSSSSFMLRKHVTVMQVR